MPTDWKSRRRQAQQASLGCEYRSILDARWCGQIYDKAMIVLSNRSASWQLVRVYVLPAPRLFLVLAMLGVLNTTGCNSKFDAALLGR
jgi:hypothetical protein